MNRNRFVQSGMTLVELLVVLVILGLLAGLVGPQVLNQLGGAKTKTALVQVKDLEQGAELFKLDVGRYPNNQEGLNALIEKPPTAPGWNGPYLKERRIPLDPWGNPYHYQFPDAQGGLKIYSLGADNAEGGTGENSDVGLNH